MLDLKTTGRVFGVGLALALGAALPTHVQAQQGPEVTAFIGVNVIPFDRERVLEDQTVLVRGSRIAEIGPTANVAVPDGARVIDAAGKYLMPGLAEMHAHIPPTAEDEAGVRRVLFLYAASGVSTARGMLGHPRHLELREQAARNEIISPRIYSSGPSLNGNSVQSPDQAARMVEEQKAAGYDFLKLHPGLSRTEFDAIDAAADRVGIAYAGHVSEDVGLERALEAGYASIDHLDGYMRQLATGGVPADVEPGLFGVNLTRWIETDRMPELARATREAGVWNVPTQSLMEHLAGPETPEELAARPEMRYVSPQTVQQWVNAKRQFQAQPLLTPESAERYIQIRRMLIQQLHEAGAGLLLGSDAPQIFNVPGFALQHELAMLVASGLTPYEALETGTRNPAIYFDALDEWGTVEPGKSADLILLEANPLEDIDNLRRKSGVMIRGRWLPQAEIEGRLNEIAAEVAGE